MAKPVASVDATPFAYVPELVTTLLQPLVESTDPAQIRALEKALTIAKGTLAKSLTRARNELIGILRGAPSGVIASPEARADEILWSACSADLEQELIVAIRTRRGRTHPSKVIDEMLAQVRHRVELALIEATDMVEVAKIQAALPPTPTRGYEPCWGEVSGVKPFGAFILLPSGESGLLHVSEMHQLNGGRRVDDPTLVRQCRSVGLRQGDWQEREGPAQLRPGERGLIMLTLLLQALLADVMTNSVAPAVSRAVLKGRAVRPACRRARGSRAAVPPRGMELLRGKPEGLARRAVRPGQGGRPMNGAPTSPRSRSL